MLTQRKEDAQKLEGMAKSKGLKLSGLKNICLLYTSPSPRDCS